MASAWDDDWETIADKQEKAEQTQTQTPKSVKLSKAQRRAIHAEEQKRLWESAETPPDQPFFIASPASAPVSSDFKPALRLLSRKPPPKFEGQVDNDSEEEARVKSEREFAERQARAAKEREEKQKKYAEVRERLFGSPKPEESSISSHDRTGTSSRNSSRGKARVGRGERDQQSQSQSPARVNPPGKKLFDPSYNPKPNSVFVQKRESQETRADGFSEVVRQPRGPDGGKGFANRSNRDAVGSNTSI